MNRNKKLANMAMLVALAMIFSYVESLIPINFGVPGMKLGVANLVTVTGLYFLEIPEVLAVSVLRVLLTGFLFGNGMSIIYSLAGAVVSLLAMVLVKKMDGISIVGVSITGGVFHNIGQILVAMAVVENLKLIYYLPVLLVAGKGAGVRNSDRVRDWNCRRKDFTGCEERSCKDSIDVKIFWGYRLAKANLIIYSMRKQESRTATGRICM